MTMNILIYHIQVANRCQFLTLEGLSTTFEGSTNVPYNKNLLTFVTIGDNTSITVYLKGNYFNIKVVRHTYNSLVKLAIIKSLLI